LLPLSHRTRHRHPFWRLRFTHYPAATDGSLTDEYGISPHVDTTFFTLLIRDSPGLTIHHAQKDQWINPPRYPTISYLQSQGVVQGE